jgi:uncharacterized membrane protein
MIEGPPYLQIYYVKTASATVTAALLGMTTISMYFEKVSIIVALIYCLMFCKVQAGPCEASDLEVSIGA